MHLECGRRVEWIVPCPGDEVSDYADIRVQRFGCSTARSTKPDVVPGRSRCAARLLRHCELRWGNSRGRRRRWRSGVFRWHRCFLRLKLTYLAFQHNEAVFEITNLLLQSRNVSVAARRGHVRCLLGRCSASQYNHKGKQHLGRSHKNSSHSTCKALCVLRLYENAYPEGLGPW